jgi:hypothetical protein
MLRLSAGLSDWANMSTGAHSSKLSRLVIVNFVMDEIYMWEMER